MCVPGFLTLRLKHCCSYIQRREGRPTCRKPGSKSLRWLGELENVSIGHGVSLLRWRSGGVEHPHDTPPYPFMPSPTFAHSSLPASAALRFAPNGGKQQTVSGLLCWRDSHPLEWQLALLRQKWSRGQVEARLANLSPCLIGMEACVGVHHLSRKLQALGHDARLMPAKYVRPYSKGQTSAMPRRSPRQCNVRRSFPARVRFGIDPPFLTIPPPAMMLAAVTALPDRNRRHAPTIPARP
jgi:hypothetical protein